MAEAGLAQSHGPAVGSSVGSGGSPDIASQHGGLRVPSAPVSENRGPSWLLVAQPQRSHGITSVVSSGRSTPAGR